MISINDERWTYILKLDEVYRHVQIIILKIIQVQQLH